MLSKLVDILNFLYHFSEKIILGILCELSAWQTIHMECQSLVSLKDTKTIKMSSAAVMISALRVKKSYLGP